MKVRHIVDAPLSRNFIQKHFSGIEFKKMIETQKNFEMSQNFNSKIKRVGGEFVGSRKNEGV